MRLSRLALILILNILGICLFFSWYLPVNHGFWFPIDKAIFFAFNHKMAINHDFAVLVAITNYRGFDAVSLVAMGCLYYGYWRKSDTNGQRHMLPIGITMLFTAVILNQCGHLLPVKHSSPSLFFPGVNHAGVLTGIPTKDGSADSFPGDHGMMLMIFACFMWRYFGVKAFSIAVVIMVVFAMPRVMAGAHWFTDIAVGSLSVVLVGLSWWLLSSGSDKMISFIDSKLPYGRRRK